MLLHAGHYLLRKSEGCYSLKYWNIIIFEGVWVASNSRFLSYSSNISERVILGGLYCIVIWTAVNSSQLKNLQFWLPWYPKWLHAISNFLNVSRASKFVKMFYVLCCEKHCRNYSSLSLHRSLVTPIGITHKKFEGNISKINTFIEIFVT